MGSPVTKAEVEQTKRGMDADTFKLLREFIYEQTGITFQENQKYLLESRLAPRLKEHKLTTYAEYLNYLRFDTYRDRELVSLYGLITTNETYFYRDQPQLDAFLKTIIPAVMDVNKTSRQLRIWSAACSSGDEPYTLALMLSDYAPLVNWNIEILATDISEPILKLAQAGVYTGHALRHVPPHLKSRHFNAQGEHFAISQTIKSRVKFMNLNLYDRPRLKLVRGIDVIFCRNCLIYFDDKAKDQIVTDLAGALKPNGYLVIGFSESLSKMSNLFQAQHIGRSVVYQKL
jgi:chemotaxis protein methyltransferase CheR